MTINRLTVMTICDKSLGEKSPKRPPASNQTRSLKRRNNIVSVRVSPQTATQEEEDGDTDRSLLFDMLGGKNQKPSRER